MVEPTLKIKGFGFQFFGLVAQLGRAADFYSYRLCLTVDELSNPLVAGLNPVKPVLVLFMIEFGKPVGFVNRQGHAIHVIQDGGCVYCREARQVQMDIGKLCYKPINFHWRCTRLKGHDGPCICCGTLSDKVHIICGFWHSVDVDPKREFLDVYQPGLQKLIPTFDSGV